jgi:hypothetical protein
MLVVVAFAQVPPEMAQEPMASATASAQQINNKLSLRLLLLRLRLLLSVLQPISPSAGDMLLHNSQWQAAAFTALDDVYVVCCPLCSYLLMDPEGTWPSPAAQHACWASHHARRTPSNKTGIIDTSS